MATCFSESARAILAPCPTIIDNRPYGSGNDPLEEGRAGSAHWMCGARRRRTGVRCRKAKLRGRTRCALHGGKSLRGVAAPAFKHGRFARDLPASLRKRLEWMLADPHFFSILDEIAVLRCRIGMCIERTGTAETSIGWKKLRRLVDGLGRTIERMPEGREQRSLLKRHQQMREIVRGAINSTQAWRELCELFDLVARLTKTEWTRLVAARVMITPQEDAVFKAALLESIRRNVRDPEALKAIANDLTALLE